MPQDIKDNGQLQMEETQDAYKRNLQSMKTGKANPAILNKVQVGYYGSNMPINQIANISTPEAQTLVIKPFDKSILGEIEKAIQLSDLNLNPQSDGSVLRIFFPPLTEQTRKDLVKEVKKELETIKVSIRNIRRDMNEKMKALEKKSEISEDELKRELEEIQKMTDKYIKSVEEISKEKEKSLLSI